jgi:hypothetical protein
VSHFYLANDIYSWDFSLNATASPPNAIPLFHGSRNRARGWLYRGGILLCGSDPDGECNFFHLASGESQQVCEGLSLLLMCALLALYRYNCVGKRMV